MFLVELCQKVFIQNILHFFPRVVAGGESQPFNDILWLSITETLFDNFFDWENIVVMRVFLCCKLYCINVLLFLIQVIIGVARVGAIY